MPCPLCQALHPNPPASINTAMCAWAHFPRQSIIHCLGVNFIVMPRIARGVDNYCKLRYYSGMKQCLVLYNPLAADSRQITEDKIVRIVGKDCGYVCASLQQEFVPLPEGCDGVLVCGGDGTLRAAINALADKDIELRYLPCGTLNERADTARSYPCEHPVLMRANGEWVSYVAATGTLCDIGYTAPRRATKRGNLLSYWRQALRSFRVHRQAASLTVDGQSVQGEYSLIMVIKSPRCFVFSFNRMYAPQAEGGHLLLIDAPKRTGLGGKIVLFWRMFRAFFVGFGKPFVGKHMRFVPWQQLHMVVPNAQWTADGEHVEWQDELQWTTQPLRPPLTVVDTKTR